MPTLIVIALRNVTRNRRRTLMTLAALVVGVGVMVSMRGLLNGLQRALITNVSQGQTGLIQVHKAGYMANVLSSPLKLDLPVEQTLSTLEHVPGVTAVAPRIAFAGMISSGDSTVYSAIIGLDPIREPLVCPLRIKTFSEHASYPGLSRADGVLLTAELAHSIGLGPDSDAALLAPDRDGVLSGENIRLTGTLRMTIPGEKKITLVPLVLAQRLLKMEDRATEFAIAVEPIENVDAIATDLRQQLGPTFEVNTYSEVAMFVRQALQRQNFIITVVAFGFMFLMLLGVANTMLMSVMERTREIGTMMAVGVRGGRILTLFVFEALVIGALGGFMGSVLGAIVVAWLSQRGLAFSAPGSSLPFTLIPFVTPQYLAAVWMLATLGAGLFAVYPAFRASRLRPVEALAGM